MLPRALSPPRLVALFSPCGVCVPQPSPTLKSVRTSVGFTMCRSPARPAPDCPSVGLSLPFRVPLLRPHPAVLDVCSLWRTKSVLARSPRSCVPHASCPSPRLPLSPCPDSCVSPRFFHQPILPRSRSPPFQIFPWCAGTLDRSLRRPSCAGKASAVGGGERYRRLENWGRLAEKRAPKHCRSEPVLWRAAFTTTSDFLEIYKCIM
jgi:hypothetical protein